ncbi:MAG: protease modulator HflC, partial [Desulfobacula sp.]|nr:protease modulator HflC [Desulfobacula sp.]
MSIRKIILISLMAVSFGAVNLIFFQVDLTQYVVVTQFGKPIRAVTDPGLHWKLPDPIQSIQRFDNRLMVFVPNKAEFLTKDKKNIVVESYPAWKIIRPIEFMKTVKDIPGAQARLTDIVSSELGFAFGKYDLTSLVTTDKNNMKLKEMMDSITRNSNDKIKEYGMSILDVRVKVLSFPEKNKLSVFQRMRAEREKIARKYRSEGSEEASKIRAQADKEKTILLSKAYEEAQKLKGEGDAQAIRIYADAFQKDPEF